MQKRISDLTDVEARLNRDNEDLKVEKNKMSTDQQKQQERDREVQRARMNEIEHKCKEIETKRTGMLFEFEKERAKWAMEKD